MGPGPIPWTAIWQYAEWRGWDLDWFNPVMQGLDRAFLDKVRKDMERESKKGGKMGGKSKGSR